MVRVAQLGIAIGLLGVVIAAMGLFPGLTGLEPTPGIGIVQIFAILAGFTLLIFGALVYVKFTFFPHTHSNLLQQVGTRLAMTGLVLAALAGLADVLGFGSHGNDPQTIIFLGPWQAIAILMNFLLSAFGVLIYALAGEPEGEE